ncbi:MAG: radical SAM family heme chaperone HemW [Pseudomonadota bacterium]|nr:radical SAM family heme chaperone HemW [Pseudomonadota bacterium]HJO35991.1 radical SAM family heme chaperone HemW [Gammaproteobacteria bacterium]
MNLAVRPAVRAENSRLGQPPRSLYVHLPWCLQKCPYCDFNSHARRRPVPEATYVDALLTDLQADLEQLPAAPLVSIFFGGGTPSLFSPAAIGRLLEGIAARTPFAAEAEITLEANPGAADAARFAGYRAAGVNRLSIGVQSFDDGALRRLGRIHDGAAARAAAEAAGAAGFSRINLDLMYALPGQSVAAALADVRLGMALTGDHLSHYQLTLEPDTPFATSPPADLPTEQTVADMQAEAESVLSSGGFAHYEVSAWGRPGGASRHNLNYWQFGDYLGIGAGAHAKITRSGGIYRLAKPAHPQRYLLAAANSRTRGGALALPTPVAPAARTFEFLLNALRLTDGVPVALFTARTGLTAAALEPARAQAVADGLLEPAPTRLQPTPLGRRFLNDLLSRFLDAEGSGGP